MSTITPVRPARRAAASRRRVVESEGSEPDADDDEPVKEEPDDDEFEEEVVAPTPRRKSRRTTTTPGPSSVAKPARGGRRVRSGDSEAPTTTPAKPRAVRSKRKPTATRKSVSETEATPEPEPKPEPDVGMAPPAPTPRALSEELPPSKQPPRSRSLAGTPPPATPPPAHTPLKTFLTDLKSPSPRSPFAPKSPLSAATPRPGSRDSMMSQMQPPLVVKSRANALLEQQQEEKLVGPKPRLVITHLVLVNFKSYAGRQEVGPFHAVGQTNTHKTHKKTQTLSSPLLSSHSSITARHSPIRKKPHADAVSISISI